MANLQKGWDAEAYRHPAFSVPGLAQFLQVIIHHHGSQGDCDRFMKVHDASDLPVVFPAANQRIGTDHERDTVGFLPDLAFLDGPGEHIVHINDIRKLIQIIPGIPAGPYA